MWARHLVAGRARKSDSGHSWHMPEAAEQRVPAACNTLHTSSSAMCAPSILRRTAWGRRSVCLKQAAPAAARLRPRREAPASALLALAPKVPISCCSAEDVALLVYEGCTDLAGGTESIWSHAQQGATKLQTQSGQVEV
jgi:hypothetical protein